MRIDQADQVLDVIRNTAVPSTWDDERLKYVTLHLCALPYQWALKNVRQWAASPNLDARGNAQPKYANTLDEVLAACGVSIRAREAVVKAAHTKGAQTMVDLRNEHELTYVGPDDPLPQGCLEYLVANGLPVPKRPVAPWNPDALRETWAEERKALPAGDPLPPEEAKALISEVVRRREAEKPAATLEGKDVLGQLAQLDLPEQLTLVVKRLVVRCEAAAAYHEDSIAENKERVEDVVAALTGEGSPNPLACLEALKLLARRARMAGTDFGMAAEALVRAYHPNLNDVRVRTVRLDDFEDDSPVVRLRVDCAQVAERPGATSGAPPPPEAPTPGPRRLGSLLPNATPRKDR